MRELGTKIEQHENLFEPDEGSIDLIYGRIGSGKTAKATRCIIASLAAGRSVYANWHLDLKAFEFDDRNKFWRGVLNIFFFRQPYYVFKKSNFHFLDVENTNIEYLSTLTDCEIYIDEGHIIFDSYEGAKFAKSKRKFILGTRHFNRKIVIITQRPTAIQVSARGNVNRFFKCTNVLRWPFVLLKVQEFQDMVGETVDDDKKPVHTEWNIMGKRVLNAYNSKYLRAGVPRSQSLYYEAYKLRFLEKVKGIFRAVFSTFRWKDRE